MSLHEMEGFVQGEPGTSFVLHKIDRVLLSGVQCLVKRTGYGSLPAEITVVPHDHGMLLSRSGEMNNTESSPVQWVFTATPRLVAGGVSTMGGSGYLARSLEFKDPAVTDLVLGSGSDLIRISFDMPVSVSGGARSGSYRFTIQTSDAVDVLIKTEFGDELKAAVALSASAQTATREGRVGEALGLWKQLLDRYPYEASDVKTADTARSTLLRDGRSQIKTLRGELERARFFQLRNGFEDCWQEASRLKTRYAGSELEAPLGDILNDIRVAREQFPEEAKLGQGYKEALVHVLRKRGAVELASKAQATGTPNNTQQGN
ncbi:MAG: hypothetical protein JKY61_02990 [Planctomycetes bacterium]|nr:hypothetical protein [Planctomycetota bacterium]